MGNTGSGEPSKEVKAIVFKALTDIKNKAKQDKNAITLK